MPVFRGVKPLLDEKEVMRKKRKPVRFRHQMKKMHFMSMQQTVYQYQFKNAGFWRSQTLIG